jgi:hypothetical protein
MRVSSEIGGFLKRVPAPPWALEDEVDHGRVGWAYLGIRAPAKTVDGLAPALLDRTSATRCARSDASRTTTP